MFLKRLLLAALFSSLRNNLINKVDFLPLREFFSRSIGQAEDASRLLTDSNPRDREQLEAWWNEHKDTLQDTSVEGIRALIEASKIDPDVKATLLEILGTLDTNGTLKTHA